MITEDTKPSVREEFSIFTYKIQLENQMKETTNTDHLKIKQLDVNKIVAF
jgi:hypothetical protein